jgi:hypothetical protein
MSSIPSHPRLRLLDPLANALAAIAEAAARSAKQTARRSRPPRGYATLRPGADTPLWNELARVSAQQLTRRGDKARLARLLGVSRQRVHLLLVAKSACPDAERALQLLAWLNTGPRQGAH